MPGFSPGASLRHVSREFMIRPDMMGHRVNQPHLHRAVMAFAGATPAAVAVAPFLAVDDVTCPAPDPNR